MQTLADVKAHIEKRLVAARAAIEVYHVESETQELRGRIRELKELLVALEAKAPPVWIDAS